MFKECKVCKLPLPSKNSFVLNPEKCNRCFRKYLHRQTLVKLRKEKKKLIKPTKYVHCSMEGIETYPPVS